MGLTFLLDIAAPVCVVPPYELQSNGNNWGNSIDVVTKIKYGGCSEDTFIKFSAG